MCVRFVLHLDTRYLKLEGVISGENHERTTAEVNEAKKTRPLRKAGVSAAWPLSLCQLENQKKTPPRKRGELLVGGIRFPQNPCSACPYLGLCLGKQELVDAALVRRPGAENLGWLDELNY
jgi:hypothetical protein